MTAKYAIADFLTDDEKRAACDAVYAPTGHDRWPTPRTRNGCCPLGVAIGASTGCVEGAPRPTAIAVALLGFGRAGASFAAGTFTSSWDAGRIPPADLPIAFGLVPDPA